MAMCSCGRKFSDKRRKLGYRICLECGEEQATDIKLERSTRIAPAYNKGPLMYITSIGMVKDLGK